MPKTQRKENDTTPAVSVDEDLQAVRLYAMADEEWVDYLINYNDIFMTNYSGYWMRGLIHDKKGWLCWEFEDDKRPLPRGGFVDRMSDADDKKHHGAAMKAYKAGKELPSHYFRLDRAAALRAQGHGLALHGKDWHDRGDSTSYDVIVQLALLGEVKYG